jgi:hypothetical protein
MSSFNNCIKFDLDIKEKNIVFKDYLYKMVQMKKHKIKVDKLLYIWVPTEQKAELFYHLVTKRLDADHNYFTVKDAYVKASDVEFHGVKLTPSNTPEEAQAAALKK